MQLYHNHNKTFGLYKLDILPYHNQNDAHHRLRFHNRDKFHCCHGVVYFFYNIFPLFYTLINDFLNFQKLFLHPSTITSIFFIDITYRK